MRLIAIFLLIIISAAFLVGFTLPNKLGAAPHNYDRIITWEDLYDEGVIETDYKNQPNPIIEGTPAAMDVVSKIKKGHVEGRWVWAKVTAYTNGPESCGPYADGFTSIMVDTNSDDPNKIYGIAVNPRVIPYRTPIYVPGYWESLQSNTNLRPTRMLKSDDTGADMRNFRPHWRTINGSRVYIEAHIDIRYRLVSTCMNWGVRYMKIFIFE